jgi:peptide chain release factor
LLQRETGIENGTVETATILLEHDNLDVFINSWIGTIQWIGQSQFRKFHKRKNWFIGIFEIEKSSATAISENDIQYQAMRSSGAGGNAYSNRNQCCFNGFEITTSEQKTGNRKIITKI